MLELKTLVSSRIRRTLLEHLISHPDDRFYLRGLAKELNLTISPLRRELKRLEQLGVLRAYDEANVRFYVVNQHAPLFQQLAQPETEQPRESPFVPAPLVLTPAKLERMDRMLERAQRWPRALSVAAVAASFAGLLGLSAYLIVANQQLLSVTSAAVSTPRPQITVVDPQLSAFPAAGHPSVLIEQPRVSVETQSVEPARPATEQSPAAGQEMRSSKWRLRPGAMGGFSAAMSSETY